MPELLQGLLSAAGNVAMIAVAVAFWKLDRRIVKLETLIGHVLTAPKKASCGDAD